MTTSHHPPTRPSGQLPTAASGAPSSVPFDGTGTDGIGVGGAGRGVRATWWYTLSSMAVFALTMPVVVLVIQRDSIERAGAAPGPLLATTEVLLVLGALTAVRGCLLMRTGLGGGWPRRRDTLLVLAPPTTLWLLTLWLPGGALTGGFPLWMALNIVAPLLVPTSQRAVFALGVLLYVLHWVLGLRITGADEGGPQLASLLILALACPLMFALSAWWWNVVVQLDAARRDAGQLAVARERLRFASDLHDIQGHHLQVIALKAELAERLLDRSRPSGEVADSGSAAGPDPGHALTAARENVHEIRSLARTALEETRSLVRDLRAVSFEEELANAKDVLEAAGADTSLRLGTIVEEPAARALLGLAIREAATNILRHSTASHVVVTLKRVAGAYALVIENDGAASSRTGEGLSEPARPDPDAADGSGPGTGLAGLDRRFEAHGGTVTGTLDGDRFTLAAHLPFAAGAVAVPGAHTEQPA